MVSIFLSNINMHAVQHVRIILPKIISFIPAIISHFRILPDIAEMSS